MCSIRSRSSEIEKNGNFSMMKITLTNNFFHLDDFSESEHVSTFALTTNKRKNKNNSIDNINSNNNNNKKLLLRPKKEEKPLNWLK